MSIHGVKEFMESPRKKKEFMESSKAMSRLLFRSAVLLDAVIALVPRIRILLKGLRVVLFNPDSMPAQCSFIDLFYAV